MEHLAQAMRARFGLCELRRRPCQLHKDHCAGRMQRYPGLLPNIRATSQAAPHMRGSRCQQTRHPYVQLSLFFSWH